MSRRRATIEIYDGDDLARLQQLRKAYADAAQAESRTSATLADTAVEDAREAYNDFRSEALERATQVTLEALPRRQWRDLAAEHPQRENTVTEPVTTQDLGEAEPSTTPGQTRTEVHEDDLFFGVNTDAIAEPLLTYWAAAPRPGAAEIRTIVDAPDDFDVEDLSAPDFDRLLGAALMLNRQSADPKELPVYERIPESDET